MVVQSHPAIPDRAEPDISLNRKNSTAAPSSHIKALVDPENRGIRIRIDFECKLPLVLIQFLSAEPYFCSKLRTIPKKDKRHKG
ncbi:hypothetical protein L873DRAFT_536263 [Choiromyces venosus 120613-1]|uniref:Uncharacterized protein n=1 Tax=Choiromyces venosus 120613-1 TaxID=1336337 RepID=A0A3N4K5C2_9PEZI|nr:hypothetical protein L873DRAFT_536263 [Choiromyces venosus 120613-1]